jgi:hypothetical protein
MTENHEEPTRLKSALFVDFDNIYLGLEELNPAASERFATDPARWLSWIEQGMRSEEDDPPKPVLERAILVRKCYLNPDMFHRFRPFFMRAAFSVVDCPPLTHRGKTSSDIHMVMDILDALEHPTHFDEFIILSGDADFTPVVVRLRTHDRRSTVIAVGPATVAYKAAAETVVDQEAFLRLALGITGDLVSAEPIDRAIPGMCTVSSEVLNAIADKFYEAASTHGETLATELPRILKTFPEFTPDSNWLGFYSLRALTQEVVSRREDLHLEEGNPWRIAVTYSKALEEGAEVFLDSQAVEGYAEDERISCAQILQVVQKVVAESDEPVVLAKVAHEVIKALGPEIAQTQWAGAGTFKHLLLQQETPGFTFTSSPAPGYVFDPQRHAAPAIVDDQQDFAGYPQVFGDFIHRLCQFTGIPTLTPLQYRVVFDAISTYVREHPFVLSTTSKVVREMCIECGESIDPRYISFILRGIAHAGHALGSNPELDTSTHLATQFRNYVLGLTQHVEIELTGDERRMLNEWFIGDPAKESSIP